MSVLIAFAILSLLFAASAFRIAPLRHLRHKMYMGSDAMDTGDFECSLEQTDYKSNKAVNLFEYTLKAKIPAKEMKVYLEEYKDEMKKRKVVFPGFRPGKLPPYVMTDVRKYIVSYGLETILGGLANLNDMQLVTEEGEDVAFGEDEFYTSIIQTDERGYDFEQQRDAWKENMDFPFSAKFFAVRDIEEEDEAAASDEGDASAIDTEIVEGSEE